MTGAVAGFGSLVRLALRRDRIRLPAWLAAVVGTSAYCSTAVRTVYGDPADLEAIVGFLAGPAGTVLSGPGYGLDDPTYGSAFAGIYGVWVLIVSAFASMALVGRHTRAEEEAGRLELVRAGRVGRAAPLVVATALAAGFNVLVLLLTWAALAGVGYDSASSALFAAGVATVGLVFAAVTAVTAQMTQHGRPAIYLAALVLAAAMLVRGAGDVVEPQGSWLSWFSPLAWSQQTRAYVDDRWWPLLVGAVVAAAVGAIAERLGQRRDLGAGLLATRGGRTRGSAVLGTPLGLALRLERSAMTGWSVALLIAGAVYGALTDSVQSSLGGLDNEMMLTVLGDDPDRLVDGYLGTCALVTALMAAGYAVGAAQRLAAEESSGRLELTLATAVSRPAWLGSVLLTAALSSSLALALGGFGMGLGATSVTGSPSYLGSSLVAHLAYLPAVWVVVGAAGLAYTLRSSWVPVAWGMVAYAAVIGILGGALDLPPWLADASPFGHVALLPLEEQGTTPLVALAAVAATLGLLAAVRFRRRDVAA